MDYAKLNEEHRKKMKQICKKDFSIEWENPNFFYTLIGKLPKIKYYQKEDTIRKEIERLRFVYSKYNFFTTDRIKFVKEIKRLIDDIHKKDKNWYGLDFYEICTCIHQQEFCLISGEGGIGKSYFIKCLEEEIEQLRIPHLCVYGKFKKDFKDIEVNDIIRVSKEGFIFIVDAVNELSENGQIQLLNILEKLIYYPKIRIIITYRKNSIENKILEQYKNMAKNEYSFPGVSFESALNELLKLSVPDIYKYEDILFSNNALLLNMLLEILSHDKIVYEKENSINSVTFILETYIKNYIRKIFKHELQFIDPKTIWKDIKHVAEWMYKNEVKEISRNNLLSNIKSGSIFISILTQAGIIGSRDYEGTLYYFFLMESLTDFLIARSLFNDISKKSFKEQVEVIKQKTKKLYSIKEAIILTIFDKLAPDYRYIKKLLKDTDLLEILTNETLIKINFNKDDINNFIKIFHCDDESNLIKAFGGYTNKPFNCVNYLNSYYKNEEKQLKELSLSLSGNHFLGNIKGRLKNIIYFLTLNNREDRRVKEAFYFAFWCCASPNQDIRCLAMKLLYEILQHNKEYKNILISMYDNVKDVYIKESIIYVLVNFQKNDSEIRSFLNKLITEEKCLVAKTIKRIAMYLHDDYGYITWKRDNLYDDNNKDLSNKLEKYFNYIDLTDKNFLPFRYWSKDHITMHTKFLNMDKHQIEKLNQLLADQYSCVQTGECNGKISFKKYIMSKYNLNYGEKLLNNDSFFSSLEVIVKKVFSLYNVSLDEKQLIGSTTEFKNSIYRKLLDISIGLFYGSLMCNYFTNEFATYNNFQDNIGYEVYDPIKYGEDIHLTTPVPIYQDKVEILGDLTINHMCYSKRKDLAWVKDANISRKNLLAILEPVVYRKEEWILLAGSISLCEKYKEDAQWIDSYYIWCCTSKNETIAENENCSYLTISPEEYVGNIEDYKNCMSKPWLCKSIENINSHSEIFDYTSLVLPPAELIRYFRLIPNYSNSSWINNNNEIVIYCNNNKKGYYTDMIQSTIFMRKDYFDKYVQNNTLKYFAFTEKYIPETGYVPETALHFEIMNHAIVKEIKNDKIGEEKIDKNPLCNNCPHGIEHETEDEEDMDEILKMIMETYTQKD